jgi:anti-repressor protein
MNLVIVNNGIPTTTTLAISEGTGNDHASVIKLVRTYQADLEQFGLVGFEIAPRIEGQHGGGNTEFANLNERQATLILSYMKNTEVIRKFKTSLVKTFYEMASRPDLASTPELQIANAILLAGRMIEEQKLQIEQRDKLISLVAPKAAALDLLECVDGYHNLTTAAKVLNVPPQKFIADLNKKEWIYRMGVTGSWTGHQPKINSGYLTHKIYRQDMPDGTEKTRAQVLITPKGMARLAVIYQEAA